jgi:hypothetical protein
MFVVGVYDVSALGSPEPQKFSNTHLGTKPWSIAGCPMTGASLTRAGAEFVLAWETKGEINFNRYDLKLGVLPPEIAVAPQGKYPVALANADGIVCVSWKEGSALRWRLLDRDNRPFGEPRSAPAPSGDRHAGALTRAGDFVLFP